MQIYLRRQFIFIALLLFSLATFSQSQPNPFRRIGKKADVIDLSKGKYVEIIEKDSLERVGSVLVNRYTRKIERFLDETQADTEVDNTAQSRFFSVDPIAAKFPYYSPYQFAGNMPIWASDLDGLEPDFRYKGNGINGVGLYDQMELASIQRHSTILRVGSNGKQFQIQWLLNNNGAVIGYLASRVVPEEEYKNLYGGRGQGLQQAYVIQADKFFEFGKNLDKYYDYSRNAEMNDVMYGEIERDPIKRLFDPRALLLSQVAGVTGKIGGQLLGIIPRLSAVEANILKQTKSILNSKEFEIIKNAHEKGISAEVKINGGTVVYNPEWTYSEAMTLHSEGGFMLGPKAFTAPGGVEQTVLWEVTRLKTQNSGSLGVDQTKTFTQSAEQTSEKLLPLLKQ